MVQIIDRPPSFGELFSQGFGSGLNQGLGQSGQFAMQLGLEKYKQKQRRALIDQIEGGASSQQLAPQQDMKKRFLEALPQIEEMTGQELTPQHLDQLWSAMNQQPQFSEKISQDPFKKAKQYAASDEHELARMATEEAKIHEKRKAEERGLFSSGVKEFWEGIQKERDKLPLLESSLEAQTNAVLRGDVDPFSRGHLADIAKGLGAPASLVAPLETPGSKQFKTGLKTYLSNTLKDAFRGTTTGREIDLAEGLLAQAGATKEGNLASLWLLQSQAMLSKEKVRLASELRKQGISGYDIPDMVEEQLQPIRKQLSDQYLQAIEQISKKK